MKFFPKKFPLHQQILLALLLGAVFGAVFNVSKYELKVTYSEQKTQRTVDLRNWEEIAFVKGDSVLAKFGADDQLAAIRYFKKIPAALLPEVGMVAQNVNVEDGIERVAEFSIPNPTGIDKVQTIATQIRPVGQLFIRLLMFCAIPLVFASLIVGAASLGDIKHVGKLGGKTIGFYFITITSAITIGLTLVNLIQPGIRLTAESKERLMTGFAPDASRALPEFDLVDMIVKIVPTNPIAAVANNEMLQIIFFALMIGVALTMVPKEKGQPVTSFFEGFSELMINMVKMIMVVAPYGVFALISAAVGEFGFEILGTLFWYALTLVIGLAIQTFVILPSLVRAFAKIKPSKFIRGMRDAMLVAFTTSSSAATLPVNMRVCDENLGVPKKISSFVLPLGATINMDGTSMYQAVATVFIAQVYGMDLNLGAQLTILLTAVLASIGTAPVPGVGIVMLMIVLKSVNVPEEGIALILGIDRFLDMCRTVPNITGDAAVATIIAKSEGVLEPR